MAAKQDSTINEVVKSLCISAKEVLESATHSAITFSPTVQKIPTTNLKPDIGCFVQISGDFSGLVIINFSAGAALEIYQKYLSSLGMPLEELAKQHTSDEVANSLGELVNQIIGKLRRELETKFGVNVKHNQPKAVTIEKSIMISIATEIAKPQCRRISLKTQNNQPFYIEMSIEQTEFILLFPLEEESETAFDFEDIMLAMQQGED
jgi:CheY-specific phosphatase CheX